MVVVLAVLRGARRLHPTTSFFISGHGLGRRVRSRTRSLRYGRRHRLQLSVEGSRSSARFSMQCKVLAPVPLDRFRPVLTVVDVCVRATDLRPIRTKVNLRRGAGRAHFLDPEALLQHLDYIASGYREVPHPTAAL